MENASKALIIAGAILIAILLISVGVLVINSINDPIDQAQDQAQTQAIEMFNSKLTHYSGEQNAIAVKQLMNIVLSTNATNASHKIDIYGYIYRKGGTINPNTLMTWLDPQKKYKVTLDISIPVYYWGKTAPTVKGQIKRIKVETIM